jgi:curli biogenesis system outer membrane secretion channel CsgG
MTRTNTFSSSLDVIGCNTKATCENKSAVVQASLLACKRFSVAGAVMVLAGCSTLPAGQKMAPDEAPVITGSAVRRNFTPLDPAFVCMAQSIRDRKQPLLGISVGDVKDYTGKFSQNEGSTITQGGSLMIYSALGKLGDVVQLQERFDTRIAELELAYTDRRQLGDGRNYSVETGKPPVPWVPYFGGSILRSNYYIVGGITELNYNIASGGAEVFVSGVGARARTFTMNIGVDLRIVDTRSLVVVKTISLQKQIVGDEVGAGVYRFFGNELLDINVGVKKQEPLQLGVRTTIEHGVIELIGAVTGVDGSQCLTQTPAQAAAQAAAARGAVAAQASSPPAMEVSKAAEPVNSPGAVASPVTGSGLTAEGLQPQNGVIAATAGTQPIPFDFGSSTMSAVATTAIEKMANDAGQGKAVSFDLVARDTEVTAPLQRRELAVQRVKSVTDALIAKGVQPSRIRVNSMVSATDPSINRLSGGYQLIASIAIGK